MLIVLLSKIINISNLTFKQFSISNSILLHLQKKENGENTEEI